MAMLDYFVAPSLQILTVKMPRILGVNTWEDLQECIEVFWKRFDLIIL